jgi:hypothetical protein
MSRKEVEKDYKRFETRIEQMAEEERTKIREKTAKIKEQAEIVGEDVDATLSESPKKKD